MFWSSNESYLLIPPPFSKAQCAMNSVQCTDVAIITNHRYVTSVSCQDGGFMLQTNVSHKMLRTDTVMDMLVELFRTNQGQFQSVATKEIVGK